jgi:predicted 2-oxoglutarate/Fe(II)-dependent dioxygenase YbiX
MAGPVIIQSSINRKIITMDHLDQIKQQMKQREENAKMAQMQKETKQAEALQPGEDLIQIIESGFSEEQLTGLCNLVREESTQAGVYNSAGDNNALDTGHIRRTKVRWLDPVEYKWVYERLLEIASQAEKKYQLGTKGIREPIQIALYDESEQGFYKWHMDWGGGVLERRISMSIPLNDPIEYEGGNLEFCIDTIISSPTQTKGNAIAFPSFISHRVTPVTKGRRYSMVVWCR